jgi:nucleoid DNA-binding protein
MTKRDLVIRISNETGLVQQEVLDVVQKTLDYIAEAVSQGRKVELRNFGVFEVKVRKARVGRNPNNPGTDVPIPQRAVVKFKPGKDMREDVLKLTPAKIAAANAMSISTGATLTSSAATASVTAAPGNGAGTPQSTP